MTFRSPRRRIFNPLRLTDPEIEQTFIARRPLLASMLGDLRAERDNRPPQHHLVVGQRGMGKTMLLCRIATELRKPEYCDRFLPLTFPEEQYIELDRISRFWLNCLDAAADALEIQGEHEEAGKLDQLVRAFEQSSGNEDEQAEQARDAFQQATQDLGRRPVLLLDNFHLLLKRLNKHDYALRGFFTRRGAPVLIGAATVMPDQLQDYGAAFYDSFKTHILYRLSVDDMREVITQLAREARRPDVAARLQAELPRLAVLRELTGGNPRTTTLLFELFAQGFSDDPYEDLECLLDQVTPLYQSRLEQLSEQAQLIFAALARHWSPATAEHVAEITHQKRSSVSPQLGRLQEIGLVEKTAIFPGKKTGYQIAERFFNIWYLMRFASRRQRASLICLTRFLQEFYTPSELTRRAQVVLNKSQLAVGEATYALALAEALPPENLSHELRTHTELLILEQAEGIQDRIAEIIDVADISPQAMAFADLKQKLSGLVPADCAVSGDEFAAAILGCISLVPSGDREFDRRAIATADKLTSEQVEALVEMTAQDVSSYATDFSESAVAYVQDRLQRGWLTAWNDQKEMQAAIAQAPNAQSAYLLGGLSDRGRLYKEAEQAYRKAAELDPKYASPRNGLGNLLTDYLGRFEEAQLAYQHALEIAPSEDSPRHNLAFLLRDVLGKPDAARELLADLHEPNRWRDTRDLHAALFAACDDNWGLAAASLRDALNEVGDVLPANTRDDWYRATAVLLHLGFGEKLLRLLQETGADTRLMPYFEAIRGHVVGDRRHLRNVPAEVRSAAENIYDEIERRRCLLPDSTK